MLRAHGVVGKFVEFFGDGLSSLSVADRATLSNMCPEYGATAVVLPGRRARRSATCAHRAAATPSTWSSATRRNRGCSGPTATRSRCSPRSSSWTWRGRAVARRTEAAAGPRRAARTCGRRSWRRSGSTRSATRRREIGAFVAEGGTVRDDRLPGGDDYRTPRSRPTATRPRRLGRDRRDHVVHEHLEPLGDGRGRPAGEEGGRGRPPGEAVGEDSLAPGSRVVTDYLDRAGLTPYLEKLGFALVGYGCTTCIGNSGPLPDEVANAVDEGDLNVVAVLSGNRNFEGRIHPQVRACYLASPPLCVAYALAGRVDIDLTTEPIGDGADGPSTSRDLWPTRRGGRRGRSATAITLGAVRDEYGRIWRRRRALGRARRRRPVRCTPGTRRRPTSRSRRSSTTLATPALGGHRGRARPGEGRRLDHHRPHLAGRLDQGGLTGRAVPAGARRGAARVQLATGRGAATTR